MNRYDRQERVTSVGKQGQEKIQQASIVIVGCGAIGSYTAEQLVRSGIHTLYLIDPDIVELSNLQRQSLFTEDDANNHELKVVAAKKHLNQINSNVNIKIFPSELSSSILAKIEYFDLLIDCCDNFFTRDLINRLAINNNFNYIFSSCAGTYGEVMFIDPRKGPCLNCLFPNINKLKNNDCDLIGISTPIIPMISSLQVSLIFNYLINDEINNQQLINVDCHKLQFNTFNIHKVKNCPVCSQNHVSLPKKTINNKIHRMCGSKTFSINFDNKIQLEKLANILNKKNINYQWNNFFINFNLDDINISYFKNAKLNIYNAKDLDQAQNIYHKFKKILEIQS